jgi:hypothetical protein
MSMHHSVMQTQYDIKCDVVFYYCISLSLLFTPKLLWAFCSFIQSSFFMVFLFFLCIKCYCSILINREIGILWTNARRTKIYLLFLSLVYSNGPYMGISIKRKISFSRFYNMKRIREGVSAYIRAMQYIHLTTLLSSIQYNLVKTGKSMIFCCGQS